MEKKIETVIGTVLEFTRINREPNDFKMKVDGTTFYSRGGTPGKNYSELLDSLGIKNNGKRVEVSFKKTEKEGLDDLLDWVHGWTGIPQEYNEIISIKLIDDLGCQKKILLN